MARLRRFVTYRSALVVVVALGALLVATKDQWDWIFESDEVQTAGAVAPALADVDPDTERLYRITSDDGSSLTYSVEENLASKTKTAEGTTTALAGDIAVNTEDPSKSRLGEIVINVEAFESDSALRDKRIRHDFLESTHNPMATFEATDISGIPDAIDGETSSDLTLEGDLTIKNVTAPVTFSGTATLSDDTLVADMTGSVLMSTYDVGPIHVAGLVHTSDEVGFALTLVARRTDVGTPPPTQPDDKVFAASIGKGEFAKTVQPILETRCVSCHEKDGPGSETILLDTAGDAAAIAEDLALVTGSRYMPPWPASKLSVPFEHDYSLTDGEIDIIAKWAEEGGGLDVDADTPLKADRPTFEPIERDQVVPSRGVYVGDLDQKDDYRCLIHEIDDPEGDGEWIAGLGFEPDKDEIVHHSIVYLAPPEAMAEAEELDGSDGRPGWTCFGLANMKTRGVRSIGGWAPGQQPRVYPEGTGIYMPPGSFIINQIHYHFDHETPPDQSVLVFDMVDAEELAARDTPMTAIAGRSYLTPAEGPCTPQESGPLCDRDAVLADIGEKYGPFAPTIPNALIGLCGGTVDDYDDLDGTKFSSSCDLAARDFGTLYSVLGHMHEFGSAYRMTLNPDTPKERILLDIPSWSFEWQLYYVPTEEIRIEPGDKVRFECTWDRSNVYMPEPRYITWNEGTVDEMCFSSVSVIPDTDVDGGANRFAPQ